MPVTDAGYKEWSKWHCTMLLLDDAEYKKTLVEWEPDFLRRGFTQEELELGTLYILEDPDRAAAAWRTHFGFICQAVKRERQRKERANGRPVTENRELQRYLDEQRRIRANGIGRPDEAKP